MWLWFETFEAYSRIGLVDFKCPALLDRMEEQLLSLVCCTGGKGSKPPPWSIQNLGAVPLCLLARSTGTIGDWVLHKLVWAGKALGRPNKIFIGFFSKSQYHDIG